MPPHHPGAGLLKAASQVAMPSRSIFILSLYKAAVPAVAAYSRPVLRRFGAGDVPNGLGLERGPSPYRHGPVPRPSAP